MAQTLGPYEFVVGSDRIHFFLTFTDENDQPISILDAQELFVQGKSPDLPAVDVNKTGTVVDAPSGLAKFAEFGNGITVAQLGSLPSATYTLRGKLKDSSGKTTFTPPFVVRWVHQPL